MRCAPFDILLGIVPRKNIVRLGRKIDPGPSSRRTRQTRVADGLKRKARTCLLLFLSVTISAQADNTVNEPNFDFDIPRQRAALALTVFAEQANLTLIVPHELLEGKISNELIGRYSLQEGIDILLAGTGLEPVISNHVVLSIVAEERSADLGGTMDIKRKTGLLAALAGIFAIGADAQEGDTIRDEGEGGQIEEIVVTGSNIRFLQNDTSPVISFDREAIEATGFSTTQQLLESLPQNFGGGIGEDSATVVTGRNDAGFNLSAGAGVNLRGLGADSTLVLVNGRRLSPGNLGSFVDISMIPLSAVERVDVLTDGASAIYGSDAIGGVVNFILRSGYEGSETSVRYGSVTDGNLEEVRLSQLLGISNDKGNLTLVFEHYERGNLDANDRSFSSKLLDPSDLFPDQDRNSLFINADYEFSQSVDAFGALTYSERSSDGTRANPNNLRITRRRSEISDWNATLGIGYNLTDTWRAEASILHSDSTTDFAIDDVETGLFDEGRELEYQTSLLQVKADGALVSTVGGEVRLAVGAEYRHEDYQRLSTGPVLDPTLPNLITPDRQVSSVFAELFIPIVGESNSRPGARRLEVSVAGRYDDYSDSAGSSTDPKFGVLWSPISSLTLRSTYGTSFRAPQLNEMDDSLSILAYFNLPDPESLTGISATALAFGPVPNLAPEESKTLTAGVDIQPEAIDGLDVRITYFNIEYMDRIASTFAFFDAFTNPEFASIVTRNPGVEFITQLEEEIPRLVNFFDLTPEDIVAFVENRTRNIAETNVSGIDLTLNYPVTTDLGDWLFTFNGNYLLELENKLTPSAPVFDLVDTAFNPIDLRVRGGVSLKKGAVALAVFANYADAYTDDQVTPSESISSWTTVDMQLTVEFHDNTPFALLRGSKLALAAQNIFDRDPPAVDDLALSNAASGYDTENATPLGRFVAIEFTKKW